MAILLGMIFYFYGDNSYAKAQQITKIKSTYISKTGGSADMEVFDMSERTMSDLLNSLAVVPMFVSSRLIVVKNLSTLKLEKEKIEKFIASVPDSTNIIIDDRSVDKRSVYFKTLSKLSGAKEFSPLSPHQLVAWIKKIATDSAAQIENNVINVLIDRVGSDQWQLEQEILKLSSYSKTITISSIDEMVVPRLSQTAFMMIDCIGRGDPRRATELYNNLSLAGEADQKILGAIIYQYRVMALVKQGGDVSDWQKELSISPYAITKSRNLVRNMDLAKIKKAYGLILSSDLSVKTGIQDSNSAMLDLIYNLSTI